MKHRKLLRRSSRKARLLTWLIMIGISIGYGLRDIFWPAWRIKLIAQGMSNPYSPPRK